MILYLIVVAIFIGILLHQYITLTRIYYSNLTLNTLKEIRYKATIYLSENVTEKMPLVTVDIFRGLLGMFDLVVLEAESMKRGLITFKSIKDVYVGILLLKWGKSGFGRIINENELSKEYAKDIKNALNTATKAIPFFYFRIIMFFIKAVTYHLLIKIGFTGLKNKLENINSYIALYKFRKGKYEMI